MILYFNNPYDRVSVNTLQFLFVNGVYPIVQTRTSNDDDHGLWISFLPTIVLCSETYQEYARIEDYHFITPDNVTWLQNNQAAIIAKTYDPATVPQGVIIKGV